jgi:hypothetical protein
MIYFWGRVSVVRNDTDIQDSAGPFICLAWSASPISDQYLFESHRASSEPLMLAYHLCRVTMYIVEPNQLNRTESRSSTYYLVSAQHAGEGDTNETSIPKTSQNAYS